MNIFIHIVRRGFLVWLIASPVMGQTLFVTPNFQGYERYNVTAIFETQSEPNVQGVGIGINRVGDRGATVLFRQLDELRFLTLDFYSTLGKIWGLQSVFSISVSSPVRGSNFDQVALNVLDTGISFFYPIQQTIYPIAALKFSRNDLRVDPQKDNTTTVELGVIINGWKRLPGAELSAQREITASGDWAENASIHYSVQIFLPVYWAK